MHFQDQICNIFEVMQNSLILEIIRYCRIINFWSYGCSCFWSYTSNFYYSEI